MLFCFCSFLQSQRSRPKRSTADAVGHRIHPASILASWPGHLWAKQIQWMVNNIIFISMLYIYIRYINYVYKNYTILNYTTNQTMFSPWHMINISFITWKIHSSTCPPAGLADPLRHSIHFRSPLVGLRGRVRLWSIHPVPKPKLPQFRWRMKT